MATVAPTEPKYASVHVAAAWAGVSMKTIHRLVRRGILPACHLGRRRLIPLEDLDRVIRGPATRPSDPDPVALEDPDRIIRGSVDRPSDPVASDDLDEVASADLPPISSDDPDRESVELPSDPAPIDDADPDEVIRDSVEPPISPLFSRRGLS
jgi:excisionase family DNA binding protein